MYFRSQCNDDIYLLFALIALGKLALSEGSVLWNSLYNDDICSLLPVIDLGKLGLGEGSALWNS